MQSRLVRIGNRIINIDNIVEIEASPDDQLVLISTAPGFDTSDAGETSEGGPHLVIVDGEDAVLLWDYLVQRADTISLQEAA